MNIFETIITPPDDLLSDDELIRSLSLNNTIWLGHSPERLGDAEFQSKIPTLYVEALDIELKVMGIPKKGINNESTKSKDFNYFLIQASSTKFKSLLLFRERLIKYFKEHLKVKSLRIIKDDSSVEIGTQFYREVNTIERSLKAFLLQFFHWTDGEEFLEEIGNQYEYNFFQKKLYPATDAFEQYAKRDIEDLSLEDLLEFCCKLAMGMRHPRSYYKELFNISTLSELNEFKERHEDKFSSFFKKYFIDKNFEQYWENLLTIKTKVNHHMSFSERQYQNSVELLDKVKSIIAEAESAFRRAVFNDDIPNSGQKFKEDRSRSNAVSDENDHWDDGLKILGKIDIKEDKSKVFKSITEGELLKHLERVQESPYSNYVGLKWFVTNYLADKSFNINTTYAIVNNMAEKGLVELYDMVSKAGYEIKAIRTKADDEEEIGWIPEV